MTPPTVAIKYGIGEGKWHGQQGFIEELEQAGFSVIERSRQADIIISHSGGCFFIPKMRSSQIIVLIDPPYWPDKPIISSVFQKVYRDFKDCFRRDNGWFFLRKTGWNLLYLLRYVRHSLAIGWSAPKQKFYEALAEHDVVLIRNHDDVWCTPDIEKLPTKGKPFIYYHLPGQHDDLWHNPAPYVAIIKEVAGG